MSYIQIEIGGKLRGLKFNQGALIVMQEKSDPGTTAFTGYALTYAGLKANCYVKEIEFIDIVEGKEIPITFEMVCDWVDELEDGVLVSVMDCFKETQAFKKLFPKEVSEEDKKKLITEPIATGLVVDT